RDSSLHLFLPVRLPPPQPQLPQLPVCLPPLRLLFGAARRPLPLPLLPPIPPHHLPEVAPPALPLPLLLLLFLPFLRLLLFLSLLVASHPLLQRVAHRGVRRAKPLHCPAAQGVARHPVVGVGGGAGGGRRGGRGGRLLLLLLLLLLLAVLVLLEAGERGGHRGRRWRQRRQRLGPRILPTRASSRRGRPRHHGNALEPRKDSSVLLARLASVLRSLALGLEALGGALGGAFGGRDDGAGGRAAVVLVFGLVRVTRGH
ncbi:hypothetical protein HDK90DRAFT_545033, partial [Phyllosticta capitalensis]